MCDCKSRKRTHVHVHMYSNGTTVQQCKSIEREREGRGERGGREGRGGGEGGEVRPLVQGGRGEIPLLDSSPASLSSSLVWWASQECAPSHRSSWC